MTGGLHEHLKASAERSKGPPKATLSRRAQSYSDFHYAVRVVLDPGPKQEEKRRSISDGDLGKSGEIGSDLDFAQWYESFQDDLLEASHDEYKYVVLFSKVPTHDCLLHIILSHV